MHFKKYRAFTLVELIVVITILAILATIWFVSFIGYQKSARESTRLSDVKLIEKQLSIYEVRNNTIPLPDNSVTITASGTTIWYQWEVGTWVLIAMKQVGDIKDPLDDGLYSFFVDTSRQNYQMMAMMEKEESLRTSFTPETYASTDYTVRYPRMFWAALWILTDTDKTPLEKIDGVTTLDVVNYSGTWYTAHYSDIENETGTWIVLRSMIQNANCNRIKQMENSNNGVYTINPRWEWEFSVYCEMRIDNGGWMLVGRTHPDSAWNTDFWWLVSTWSLSNDSTAYSLGTSVKKIDFDQILIAAYYEWKDIVAGVRHNIDRNFFQAGVESPDVDMANQYSATSNCTEVYNIIDPAFDTGCNDNGGYRYWWAFGYQGRFVFNRQNHSEEGLVLSQVITSSNNGLTKDKDSGWDSGYDNMRW